MKTISKTTTWGDAVDDINNNFLTPPKCSMYNTAAISATLSVAETWYSLTDALLVGANLKDFTFSSGVFTYTGTATIPFLFSGSANIEVDKVCEITFGLFKNAETTPIVGGSTPVDVETPSKKGNIAIGVPISLSTGDTVTVKAKSDTDTINLTVATISTVLWP